LFGSLCFDHSAGGLEPGGRVGWGVQAVVADLDESVRQDVLEEAPDELVGRKAGDGVALGAEEDGVVGEVEKALVGDADTMSVAPEVPDHLFRARRTAPWRRRPRRSCRADP
jgi:hypothetical protein